MDELEQRQVRSEYELDDLVTVDLPLWYLRLTAPIAGQWRREVGVVALAFILGLAVGFSVALVMAHR